jgi:hypothetical protein
MQNDDDIADREQGKCNYGKAAIVPGFESILPLAFRLLVSAAC